MEVLSKVGGNFVGALRAELMKRDADILVQLAPTPSSLKLSVWSTRHYIRDGK